MGRWWLWLLLIPSLLGGLVGALLLSRTGDRSFVEFVPWLVGLATLIILLRPILLRRTEGDSKTPNFAAALWPIVMAIIFMIALYLLSGCLRGLAVMVFIIQGNVDWKYGAPMALGGLIGGYLGGLVSHRVNRSIVRLIVIAIGFAVAAYYFWKLYSPSVMRIGGE